MRRIFTLLLLAGSAELFAQSDDREAAMAVVNRLFEAMRTNDSTLLRTCFTTDVRMSTVMIDAKGVTRLQEGTLSQFLEAVAKPKSVVLNEPIWNEQVQIDGSLAAIWVDYAFYLTNTFSHCGVDAFHLVKTTDGWKIFNLVDTRRKEGCVVPAEVRSRYEGK
jgi:hypothetical protein